MAVNKIRLLFPFMPGHTRVTSLFAFLFEGFALEVGGGVELRGSEGWGCKLGGCKVLGLNGFKIWVCIILTLKF